MCVCFIQNAEVIPPPQSDRVDVTLGPDDRRFGFSVVGGREEGFPPRIDEIAPGPYSRGSSIHSLVGRE